MKIFIINLKSSTGRRQRIRRQLESQGIPHEFFHAVDGRKQEHLLFKKYDDKKRKRYKRYRLTRSQLGCYASHYLLWEKCLKRNEPIMVLEDDANIDGKFHLCLNEAKKVIDQYPYIRLAALSEGKPFVKIQAYGSYKLVRYLKGPAGTQGYVIHPKAAEAFLKFSRKWFVPVDDFMDKFWLHKVDCLGLMPYSIIGNDSESTIYKEECYYDSLFDLLVRRVCRYLDRFGRFCYNIKKNSSSN